LSRQRELLVRRIREESQRKAFGFDCLYLTAAAEERLDSTGIRHLDGLTEIVPDREDHSHILSIHAPLLQSIVEQLEHVCRIWALGRGGAHDAAHHGGVERCGRGLATRIPQRDAGVVGVIAKKVIEIPADGARGQKAGCEFGMGVLWTLLR
jgi:hypothetical protein